MLTEAFLLYTQHCVSHHRQHYIRAFLRSTNSTAYRHPSTLWTALCTNFSCVGPLVETPLLYSPIFQLCWTPCRPLYSTFQLRGPGAYFHWQSNFWVRCTSWLLLPLRWYRSLQTINSKRPLGPWPFRANINYKCTKIFPLVSMMPADESHLFTTRDKTTDHDLVASLILTSE